MSWQDVSFLTVSPNFLNITIYGMSRSIALDSIERLELPYVSHSKAFAILKLISIVWWEEGMRILAGQHQVVVTVSTGEKYSFWVDDNGFKFLLPFAENI